jgi:Icc-related predicted phosphoesterase
MQILALADIHDDQRVLDRVRMLLSKKRFDAVFFAGDLSSSGSVQFAEEFSELFTNLFAVPGNMDRKQVIGVFEKSGSNVHNKKMKLGEWDVVGFGGSNHVGRVPFAHSEAEISDSLLSLGIGRSTILLTHMPPRGCFDLVDGENIGSEAIREVVVEKKPFINICGHVHEHEGEQMLGDTIVVSIGPGEGLRAAIIKLEKGEVEVDFINL